MVSGTNTFFFSQFLGHFTYNNNNNSPCTCYLFSHLFHKIKIIIIKKTERERETGNRLFIVKFLCLFLFLKQSMSELTIFIHFNTFIFHYNSSSLIFILVSNERARERK